MTSAEIAAILTDIHARLEPLVDEAYLAKIGQSVPTHWRIWGVRVPQLRQLATELHKAHQQISAETLHQLLDEAFADHGREPVLCLIFWLAKRKRDLTLTTWSAIDRWLSEVADWEICDQLAMSLAAPIVYAHPELFKPLQAWTQSNQHWRRRFTMATGASLNQKGRCHSAETATLAQPLLNDPELMVRKAVGWALREASQCDAQPVFELLLANRASTHPTVLRESAQKLSDDLRAQLLDG